MTVRLAQSVVIETKCSQSFFKGKTKHARTQTQKTHIFSKGKSAKKGGKN